MNTTTVSSTTQQIVNRILQIEGVSQNIAITKNELEDSISCNYTRINNDENTTTVIVLKYTLSQSKFTQDILGAPLSVDDYTLFAELKNQVLMLLNDEDNEQAANEETTNDEA